MPTRSWSNTRLRSITLPMPPAETMPLYIASSDGAERAGVLLVVRVHEVADDRRLALRVAELVGQRAGDDPQPVVAEGRAR